MLIQRHVVCTWTTLSVFVHSPSTCGLLFVVQGTVLLEIPLGCLALAVGGISSSFNLALAFCSYAFCASFLAHFLSFWAVCLWHHGNILPMKKLRLWGIVAMSLLNSKGYSIGNVSFTTPL
eukprot:415717-Amphidinium_carterae.1